MLAVNSHRFELGCALCAGSLALAQIVKRFGQQPAAYQNGTGDRPRCDFDRHQAKQRIRHRPGVQDIFGLVGRILLAQKSALQSMAQQRSSPAQRQIGKKKIGSGIGAWPNEAIGLIVCGRGRGRGRGRGFAFSAG